MPINRMFTCSLAVSLAAAALLVGGCDKKSPNPAPPTGTHGAAPGSGHEHAHGNDHGHATPLGEHTAAGVTVKASRDGDLTPGGDAGIDVWVTGGDAKVAAVRFWIGAQDARGSVKAKAAIEGDHWHTHVEVPNPMPADSRLWVEIEFETGKTTLTGFDLKP